MQCDAAGSLEVLNAPPQHGYLTTRDLNQALRISLSLALRPTSFWFSTPLHCDEERKLPIFALSQCIWQELRSIKENIRGESSPTSQRKDGIISCMKHVPFKSFCEYYKVCICTFSTRLSTYHYLPSENNDINYSVSLTLLVYNIRSQLSSITISISQYSCFLFLIVKLSH